MALLLVIVRWVHLWASIPPAGPVHIRIGDCCAICKESARNPSAFVFVSPPVDLPLCLGDLGDRSTFLDRMALARYGIDERRGHACVHQS